MKLFAKRPEPSIFQPCFAKNNLALRRFAVFVLFTMHIAIAGCQQESSARTPDDAETANPLSLEAVSATNNWKVSVHINTLQAPAGALVGDYLDATLTVQDANGATLDNVSMRLDGGMPGHGHGLPSTPEVLASDKAGEYRIQGLKFNMPGEWVLELYMQHQLTQDFVRWEFSIAY